MYNNTRLGRYVLLMGLCAGVAGMVFLQYASAQYSMDEKPAMKMDSDMMSPVMQIAHGVLPNHVQCKENMQLVFKSSNNMPACVKSTSAQRLIQIGWAKPSGMMNQENPIHKLELNAVEEDEKYMWSNTDGNNPDLTLVANTQNTIQIKNPTDAKHELVIEAEDKELAASGDIDGDGNGMLTITPTMTGTFEYHCEYHPSTMKGTIHIVSP